MSGYLVAALLLALGAVSGLLALVVWVARQDNRRPTVSVSRDDMTRLRQRLADVRRATAAAPVMADGVVLAALEAAGDVAGFSPTPPPTPDWPGDPAMPHETPPPGRAS